MLTNAGKHHQKALVPFGTGKRLRIMIGLPIACGYHAENARSRTAPYAESDRQHWQARYSIRSIRLRMCGSGIVSRVLSPRREAYWPWGCESVGERERNEGEK